jgi:Zn finger protein HypA/HybF involved in hydrogenase expression
MRMTNCIEQKGTLAQNADSRISGTPTEYLCTCGEKNMATHDSMCRACWDRLSARENKANVTPVTACRSIPE